MVDKKILRLDEIEFDQELYPRNSVDWLISYRYSQAMKSGAEFPPIQVAKFEGKFILVDGMHRINAKKNLKEEYIDAIVRTGLTKDQIYIEAVKANIKHGKSLSAFDKAKIIIKLEDMKMSLKEISEIINIPSEKLKSFVANRLTTTSIGSKILLKAPLRFLSKSDTQVDESIREEQYPMKGSHDIRLVRDLTIVLKNELDRKFDKNFLKELGELNKYINLIINRVKVPVSS